MIRSGFTAVLLFLPLLFLNTLLRAQPGQVILQGSVWEKMPGGTERPVPAVKVGFSKNRFAFTDGEGKFALPAPDTVKKIWVYYERVGTDTIAVSDPEKEIKVVFPFVQKLKDVKIGEKRFSTEISLLSMVKTERISSKELLKAACCNLSESFETTPSVDVAFTDAVTGYRQIQLLGLAGPYTLITRENIPEVRGLAAVTGLTFTPGQWIESMQLSKGTGSVVNGYEGLAGQINIELMKPMEGDKIFANLYQSVQGRSEVNAYARFEPKEGLYGNLFLHGKSQWLKVDQNHDHYIDQPMGNSFIGANRWMWFGKHGRELQVGAKVVALDNTGGSMHYNASEDPAQSTYWGMQTGIRRVEAWAKLGKVFEQKPWKSMGLQLNYSGHSQDMAFGRKVYRADEKTLYGNYIFQTIIGNTNRVLKMGATGSYSDRHEQLNTSHYANKEISGGAFAEYAHTFSRKVNAVLGVRTDYHNLYGLYVTPRLHFRYAPIDNIAFRASVGPAYRTASIFAENPGFLATNRTVLVMPSQATGVYGLQNERAVNAGLNGTYRFKLNYRPGTLSADYYYTRFLNQVLADWEHERFLTFYNSRDLSYAHSMQVQLDYEPIRKFDVRLAYRFNDVYATYGGVLKQKPLNARHRAFVNAGYTTRSKWSFDGTVTWTGSKRIPSTALNPAGERFPERSPSFWTINAHVNKVLGSGFELYAGVENLLNYMQQTAILGADQPFGPHFDGSLIWGPTMGRNVYGGVRWRMK